MPAFLSEAIDRFPDCVRLTVVPRCDIPSELQLDFELTFADMWLDCETSRFPFLTEHWRFRFALSSGELSLILNRLSSAPTKRNFQRALRTTETVSRTVSRQTTDNLQNTVRAGISLSEQVPDVSFDHTSGSSRSGMSQTTDAYAERHVVVYHKGTSDAPKWVFTCQALDDCLAGTIADRLATLDVVGLPCSLTASFATSLESIRILEVDSVDFARASPKRQAVLKIKMRNYVREASKDALSTGLVRSVAVS